MRRFLALLGPIVVLHLVIPSPARALDLVELRIETLTSTANITAASGERLLITLNDPASLALWVTPTLDPSRDSVTVTIVYATVSGRPESEGGQVAFGQALEVVPAGVWMGITPLHIERTQLLEYFLSNKRYSQVKTLNLAGEEQCCLATANGVRCGCRVVAGDRCCAEPPCSCGLLY